MSTESAARWSKNNPEKAAANARAWRRRNPKYMMHHHAKRRAQQKGIEFDIVIDDIPDIPDVCPIAGIPLSFRDDGGRGPCDNSPSLDRIRGELGYIPGNIRVISHRGNRWKGEMTRDEAQRVLDYIDGKI